MLSLIKNTLLPIVRNSGLNISLASEIPKVTTKFVDIVLILDSSLSMKENDPQNIRKQAAINFINALYPEDRVCVIDFGINAQILNNLTTNKTLALSSVQKTIARDEGTYIDKAIKLAINEIQKNANNNHRAIILFTDGGGRYKEQLNLEARKSNIKIFTVGLGSKIKTYLLQSMALKTGGKYLHASNAYELIEIFQRLQHTLRLMAKNNGQLLLK